MDYLFLANSSEKLNNRANPELNPVSSQPLLQLLNLRLPTTITKFILRLNGDFLAFGLCLGLLVSFKSIVSVKLD